MFCDDIVKGDHRGTQEGHEQAGEVGSGCEASARQIILGVAFLEGPETCRVSGIAYGFVSVIRWIIPPLS